MPTSTEVHIWHPQIHLPSPLLHHQDPSRLTSPLVLSATVQHPGRTAAWLLGSQAGLHPQG